MSRVRLPRGFNAWVATSVGTELGSGVLAFALTWVGSGYGPNVAAGVLTLAIAPSVIFGLLGGAVADRFGPRRVMIAGMSALMMISGSLALVVLAWGVSPVLLLLAATLIGTVAAFHRPAVGVFPRLFVDDDDLGAAMARAGTASQIARTVAPPLGGVLIGVISLHGIALIDVVGCAAMATTLTFIRPPRERTVAPEAGSLRGIVQGITSARHTPGIPVLLIAVAIVAGAVIPAVVLGIPLTARERGWSAAEAGLIEAGWIAGGLLCGAWFAWRGTSARPWRPMAIGPMVIAAGLGSLALSSNWVVATGSTVVVGIGVVVFTAHLFPTYTSLAPPEMMARFQSLLILAQQVPQLPMNPLIGFAVSRFGSAAMLGASMLLAAIASLVIVKEQSLRTGVDTA